MAGKVKGKPYETVAVHGARAHWQASLNALQALYVERDRLHEAYGPDAEIGQLNQQIEEAQQEERDTWQAYCEIANLFLAA